MTAQTVSSMTTATWPRVDLLPPEIAEAARFRRLQAGMGAVVAGAAVIVGVLYTGAHHSVGAAQDQLTAAQSQVTSLTSQVHELSSVSDVYSQVASAKQLLSTAMGNEVRWSYYLEDLSLRIPNSVWLTAMTVAPSTSSSTTTTAPTAGSTSQPAAIAPSDQVATITFSGDALSRDDVAKWLNAIAAEKGWSDPYVTSITESKIGPRTVYSWNGTVDVTSAAQSHRYDDNAGS